MVKSLAKPVTKAITRKAIQVGGKEGGKFAISDDNGDYLILFNKKKVFFNSYSYDIVEEEQKYRDAIKVETYYPEYGLFIMKGLKLGNKYRVEIGKEKGTIETGANFVKFKTPEEYVLEGYPSLSKTNPLHILPNENSDIIEGFENYTYVSVEIHGDWLKVKDDKDCYIGEEPSEKDILGWVRWKKNGEVILEVRQVC